MTTWGGALPRTTPIPANPNYRYATVASIPATVDRTLPFTTRVLDYYHQRGPTCVAFSIDQALTFFNGRLYHPGWLYHRAGGDGSGGIGTETALDIVRTQGNVVVPLPGPDLADESDLPNANPSATEGINEYRWLTREGQPALDQARAAIASGTPLLWAFPAYGETFRDGHRYLSPEPSTGTFWHQVCINGAHDSGAYFETPNTGGSGANNVLRISYDTFKRLTDEHGAYGAVITDLVSGNEQPQPDYPTFTCPKCHRTFPTAKKLKRHRRLRRH